MDRAAPGARLIYWNMMVPRGVPARLADQVRSLDELARVLHERDRAFFYQSFHVDEVGDGGMAGGMAEGVAEDVAEGVAEGAAEGVNDV